MMLCTYMLNPVLIIVINHFPNPSYTHEESMLSTQLSQQVNQHDNTFHKYKHAYM